MASAVERAKRARLVLSVPSMEQLEEVSSKEEELRSVELEVSDLKRKVDDCTKIVFDPQEMYSLKKSVTLLERVLYAHQDRLRGMKLLHLVSGKDLVKDCRDELQNRSQVALRDLQAQCVTINKGAQERLKLQRLTMGALEDQMQYHNNRITELRGELQSLPVRTGMTKFHDPKFEQLWDDIRDREKDAGYWAMHWYQKTCQGKPSNIENSQRLRRRQSKTGLLD
eukprot:gnl/TRDRNA2_/TRDRNA2_82075_c1_seq2.p1 gnl/TRDRNA2_/TRDRNA2_82075_c1~~gnl/TRDRNA2_/TRDRNA2_82075_c1_seq2.p1  ORF type:complete len:225 (+),score=29.18 gnl/TRDRNA2_/TRDRNA2_82075_c1_seq2:91-765(+)